ncbi:MAG: thioredoxin family protein [Ferruginibacter sp.]
MKNILAVICCFAAMSFATWETDLDKAKQIAKEKHELILLNFSGSDWCGPCIRMKKEIFDSREFVEIAEKNLVLLNADFPRGKKNQLSKEVKHNNEALADKYNPEGKFPFTLLLDANGKIIRSWDGLPDENATAFTKLIKGLCDANR